MSSPEYLSVRHCDVTRPTAIPEPYHSLTGRLSSAQRHVVLRLWREGRSSPEASDFTGAVATLAFDGRAAMLQGLSVLELCLVSGRGGGGGGAGPDWLQMFKALCVFLFCRVCALGLDKIESEFTIHLPMFSIM